ncbi:LuxR family transcriptional regulator [Geodermatophilus sp. TF02-6]|uniref:cupin domain-containing protein n=1 Tax=Geodermatophilus sp. TF02-6 TaxID=2250575 RepID=UPI000DE8725B|nr:cupin domain-containing protein [Geodermatophilus sp. TF02-6]RBY75768.1 LuxR family transcriptional regulator [Geodermatophilus sp. TF02-6]
MALTDLERRGRELLAAAREHGSGRAADTVVGGADQALRQTLLALVAGARLAEHENPGEATLQVLEGSVRLVAGATAEDGERGDLLAVPEERHALEAVTDAVVLLTVVKR